MVTISEDDYFAHYGTPRRSGRYPWGSGGDNQSGLPRNASFADHVTHLRKQGLKDTEICEALGIGTTDKDGKFRPSTTQLRAKYTISKTENQQAKITMAQSLKDKGYSNGAIAERMGLPGESSVRALLAPGAKDRVDVLTATSNVLKKHVDEANDGLLTPIDIGSGVENYMGVSKEKLGAAVAILREQGYVDYTINVPQLGTGFDTKTKVLCPPGTTWGEAQKAYVRLKQVQEFSNDGGRTFPGRIQKPLAVSPNRVGINYKEDGGDKADGVIYVRPGVKDISLGNAKYAQVRIQVGKDRYLKGMAMYKDDLPDGVDLVFNTNKSSKDNTKLSVMKKLESDPDHPFGTVIRRQIQDPKTEKVTSAMNIVHEEGDWEGWSKSLSTQFLSKQSPRLAKTQLDVVHERRRNDLDKIKKLTNPTVKKKLLQDFADDTDSAAVHLEAAALSDRQAWHAILPINSLPPTHVYAPRFRDGETVALIRFPHGGTFEIPELTVNNRHREARKLLGVNAPDVVGIHHTVAERLSGADFDGDTVIVIPVGGNRRIKTSPALTGLRNFDPKKYALPDDSPIPRMTAHEKKVQMGNVSNLITDMTIRGASHDKIARAVRHSMVVIDAEKHGLDWRQSARDNNIADLKREYQGGARKGASTLISRASAEIRVPESKPRPAALGGPINKTTGRRETVPSGRTRPGPDGTPVPRMVRSKRLAETHDAHSLIDHPGTPMERTYADHSNRLKDMANEARLETLRTPRLVYSASANKHYKTEVESLDHKLALAQMNRPRERQAQAVAASMVRARLDANPNLDKEDRKKIEFQELEIARTRLGAKPQKIEITQKEWDAIQAGAISDNKLTQILNKADIEIVRQLATPRQQNLMTPALTKRAAAMLNSGYTRAEVASQLGVSLTTLDTATNE